MLVPYSTDAPIYHYPIATIALIVINVIFFFAFCIPHEGDEEYRFVDSEGREISEFEAVHGHSQTHRWSVRSALCPGIW